MVRAQDSPTKPKLERVWLISWVMGKHGFKRKLTGKERGQISEIIETCGIQLGIALLAEAPAHWDDLRDHWKQKLGWQKVSELPNLGLLLAGHSAALGWLEERAKAAQSFASPAASTSDEDDWSDLA